MSAGPISILFLCTGNSARSIMAEALANGRFGDRLLAWSAGSTPKGAPHPLALETLERHGIDVRGLRSKGWETVADQRFDLVATLCGSAARETCPTFPGAPLVVHWGFPDPPAADDPERAFEDVLEGLLAALTLLTAEPDKPLADRAARVADHIAASFA